jgi:hypothetical protein
MRPQIRKRAGNLLLLLASLLISYLVLELVFFRIALPYLSLNLHVHLPVRARALVQTSKSSYLPHDYIALLGDSYAAGIGDWLLATNNDRTKPYHSAHIIHDLTGRDVVSFGHGPGGSAEGLVLRPTSALDLSECYLFPSLEAPKNFIHYFFEGNDLEDNLAFLAEVTRSYGDTSERSISRYLTEYYAANSTWRCHLQFGNSLGRMARFVSRRYAFMEAAFKHTTLPPGPSLMIAGSAISAPPLFGPALGLSDEAFEPALRTFDQSLGWLRGRWPDIPIMVVYIPAPLSVYRLAVTSNLGLYQFGPINVAVKNPLGIPAWSMADHNSSFICQRIRGFSIRHGAKFIDTRAALRAAAAKRPIHGPADWSHLNEAGYRILGELVASSLTSGPSNGACDN